MAEIAGVDNVSLRGL